MDGYLNNKTRVLNEWFNLFKQQKSYVLSMKDIKHWEHITKFGLLNFKNDYCKYSSIEKFLRFHFVFSKNFKLDLLKCQELSLSIDCHRLVFINGCFFPILSDYMIDPWIVKIENFNNCNISQPICPNIFLYLTECLSNKIIKIKLPEKSITKKPLYLLYINSGSNITNQLVTSHYNHYLDIGKDTNAFVIEHFISVNNNKHFTGSRMIMSINEGSKLDHVKLIFENSNSYHISHQDININNSAAVNSNTFVIDGPKFVHNKINSKINHLQSSLSINSLSFLSKKNICNILTYIEHNNTNSSISKQLHKIIATNHSIGIFEGLIKVNQKSINTNATMINNNLLLHRSASIYSIPKLEIYSDAVQCKHGSTIGQINSNDLFYLNTRGITKEDALKILTYAFTEDLIKKIKHSLLKNFIIQKIDYVLTGKK